MCAFHDSNCNGFGDMWWTDKCTYFSSIDSLSDEKVACPLDAFQMDAFQFQRANMTRSSWTRPNNTCNIHVSIVRV